MRSFLLAVSLVSACARAETAAPPPFECPAVAVTGDGSFAWPANAAGPPAADRWEWPLGPPSGEGYYDAQPFGRNAHLGADLNAVGRNDFGDPVHVVADGCVTFARDIWRGWGNVVRVVHRVPGGGFVETLYAHLDHIDVAPGRAVRRGDVLGVVGDAHGRYGPHLHLELRTTVGLPQGGGYGASAGYADPMAFLAARR